MSTGSKNPVSRLAIVLRTDGGACGDGKVWMDWGRILKVGMAYILNVRDERKRNQGWLPGR